MHLFYPSHDIALANGVRHFNPPHAAKRLEEDLATLAEIWNHTSPIPIPWGWDYDTRAFLNKEYKIKLKDLPSDKDLTLLRDISSRKTTIEILKRLKEVMPGSFEEIALPVFIEEIEGFDGFVLKTPWSCSGRGLTRISIKKQGGIILEPWYGNKTQDLAELFYVGKDGVRFVGYSIFHNDDNSTYRYGELMSNALMSASLPQICRDTRDALIPILNDIFKPFFNKTWEVGYIGIDMFLLENGGLNPIVEMNVRCTMGVVARLFFDQTFGEDSNRIGEFYISPALDYERLKKMDKEFSKLYNDNYHRLTEITPDTMFMAYAIMT